MDTLSLQRHLHVLTKFSHVELRLSGRQQPTEVVFYAPLNLCDRRVCSAYVAVGLSAFSRHAPLPLLFRGFQAITGRDKPVCTGAFQYSWLTGSALELLDIMLLSQRTHMLDNDLHRWTPVRVGDMGWHQGTRSSHP